MGPRGGFRLHKDPSKITLKEIIDITQDGIRLNKCLTGGEGCDFDQDCEIHKKLVCLQLYIDGYFSAITLEDVIKGRMGSIVRPERLFLRSIAQFYTRRRNENILTGHAIFIDRLAFPELDLKYAKSIQVEGNEVGKITPLFYPDNKTTNIGQILTYFILDTVTKNHFPEVIGYPDPLHKADWGAKSMRDSVKKLLESSEWKFRSNPLTNTLREIRQKFKR